MIRNEDIRGKMGVALVVDKMWEAKLRWFRHVKRTSTDAPMRKYERLAIIGLRRGSSRPRKNWGNVIRHDMAHLEFTEDMTLALSTLSTLSSTYQYHYYQYYYSCFFYLGYLYFFVVSTFLFYCISTIAFTFVFVKLFWKRFFEPWVYRKQPLHLT